MDFKVSLYFGERYRAERIGTILGAIGQWLSDDPIVAQFSPDIEVGEITYARLSKHELFSGQQVWLRLNEPSFRDLIHEKYLEKLTCLLRRNHRHVSLVPWVADDDTATYELKFALNDGEESWAVARLVAETCGERELLTALETVDPLWATVGIISVTPVLVGIRNGDEGFPDCGYYGSKLVARIGRNELLETLGSCPKVESLPSGGVFLCWGWSDVSGRNASYPSFREGIDAAAKRVSDDLLSE